MQPTGEATAGREERGLIRGIRRWDLVLLVLNAIIGAGIFGLPARVYAIAGSYSLLAYLVCGALVVLIILCFAEVSSRFQTTGGPYLYAREAFGSFFGFQMGWLLWLARVTAFASLCNLWVSYLGFFRPSVTSGVERTAVITLVVLVLTALNLRGVRGSALFNNVFTIGKLIPLGLLVLVGLFYVEPGNFTFADPPDFPAFSAAVLMLMFAFSGFEMSVIPAGETTEPRRHAPFALLAGVGIVALLYMLIQIVSIGTVPELATSERPLADAGRAILGAPGGALIAFGALVSVTGTLNTIVLVGPRLLYAMSEQRQLPAIFATTHPTYRTPWAAILLSSVVVLVLTLQATFISALTITTLIRLVTYAATCAAVPVLRRSGKVPEAGFVIPGGGYVAVAAIVLCGWLMATSNIRDVRLTLLCAAGGILLYGAMRVVQRGR